MEETEEEIRKLSMELGVLDKEIEDLNKEPEETVEIVEEPPEPVVVLPSEAADSDTRWPCQMKTFKIISLKCKGVEFSKFNLMRKYKTKIHQQSFRCKKIIYFRIDSLE